MKDTNPVSCSGLLCTSTPVSPPCMSLSPPKSTPSTTGIPWSPPGTPQSHNPAATSPLISDFPACGDLGDCVLLLGCTGPFSSWLCREGETPRGIPSTEGAGDSRLSVVFMWLRWDLRAAAEAAPGGYVKLCCYSPLGGGCQLPSPTAVGTPRTFVINLCHLSPPDRGRITFAGKLQTSRALNSAEEEFGGEFF